MTGSLNPFPPGSRPAPEGPDSRLVDQGSLRVLITNDDGIAAPGLLWLAREAAARGHDVVVAAPREEASGSSAALAAIEKGGRIIIERSELPGIEHVPAYGVASSPAFISLLALRRAFGERRPDVVLSGVNRGANTGRAVLHSGTVGAALTAATAGVPGMAVSLDVLSRASGTPDSAPLVAIAPDATDDHIRHWATAARVAVDLLPALTAAGPCAVFNLNVPNVPHADLPGIRRATLATYGQVRMSVLETGEDFVTVTMEELNRPPAPGSDVAVLAEGYASLTPIRPVTEDPGADLSAVPLR